MSKRFDLDKQFGETAEARFVATLIRDGYNCIVIHGEGPNGDWDISSTSGTFEVKADRIAPVTRRFFVETAYKGQPSGLFGTKADYFVVIIQDSAWVSKTSDWKEWLLKHEQYKGFKKLEKAGDDGNSSGYLIDLNLLPKVWGVKEWKL